MDKTDPSSDHSLAFVAVLLLLVSVLNQFRSPLLALYNGNRYLVALLISVGIMAVALYVRRKILEWRAPLMLKHEVLGKSPTEDSVLAGISEEGTPVYIKKSFRRMHTQVVGTTNAGKTESVILPWAIDDIKKGAGLLIIDGKSDRTLLDKLYAYAKIYKREHDVRILSLCDVSLSHTFNPLANGTPLEVTERVFKALTFENEYYKNLQYESLLQTLLIFEAARIKPTPLRIVEALRSPRQLQHLALLGGKPSQIEWVLAQLSLSREEREQRTSGLITQLQMLSVGETARIFNSDNPDIDMETALAKGHIIYCQLPVLKMPTLGKAVGKLVLQCTQSAIASRHLGTSDGRDFFTAYLDDFTEYLTEGFVSLLNKSRSANFAIVFAHQAMGDLAILGDAIKNTILTNANLKVFMRTNEPESAEYFSQTIGTIQTDKVTERQTSGFFGHTRTGDGSVREAEEFKFHPNLFKQGLGVGEAVLVLPHSRGSLPVKIKFRMAPNLEKPVIPEVIKSEPVGLPPVPDNQKVNGRQSKSDSVDVISQKTISAVKAAAMREVG